MIDFEISNCRNHECQNELAKWNMKLDTDLVKFEARVLDADPPRTSD